MKRSLPLMLGFLTLALNAGCSADGRAGTLAGTATLPTASCSVGIGGRFSMTNIPASLNAVRVEWNVDANSSFTDNIGLVDPETNQRPSANTTVSLTAPPWSSTNDISRSDPGVLVTYTFSDNSTIQRAWTCTKGTDSPTPTIECSHTGPGQVGEKGTVYIAQSDVTALGTDARNVSARWWWKGLDVWVAVLQPWLTAIPDTWTSVEFAEQTEHALPGTTSTTKTGYQEFSSTPELDVPSKFAGAYIGHVRVQIFDERHRPLSFPAEADC